MGSLDFASLLEKVGEETKTEAIAAGREIRELLVSSIGYYDKNRDLTDEDCLTLLAELQDDGFDLTHPIVVFPDARDDRDFTLIAGERRLRAFQLGNQEKIIAIIRRDLTERQIREKNIKENTQRMDESLASLSRRYKDYCDDYNVKQKEAARIFNVKESLFSDMVKYLWQVDKIPATKALLAEGVSDKYMLKELVRASLKNESAVKSIIAFCKANNCFYRDFVIAAVKMDLYGDIEADLRNLLAGGLDKKNIKTEEQLKLSGIDTKTDLSDKPGSEDSEADLSDKPGSEDSEADLSDKSGSDDSEADLSDKPGSDDSEADLSDKPGSEDSEADLSDKSGSDDSEADLSDKSGSDDSGVKKRPVSKAEIMVEFEGKQFYLELGLVAEDEDKIVLRNLAGDIVLAAAGEVKICYVS